MGAWLPECAYRQGYEYVGKDGKNTGDQLLKLLFKIMIFITSLQNLM